MYGRASTRTSAFCAEESLAGIWAASGGKGAIVAANKKAPRTFRPLGLPIVLLTVTGCRSCGRSQSQECDGKICTWNRPARAWSAHPGDPMSTKNKLLQSAIAGILAAGIAQAAEDPKAAPKE